VGCFLQVSLPKSYLHLSSFPARATCLAHLIFLHLITRSTNRYAVFSSLMFLSQPHRSALSVNAQDRVSHPCSTTDTITLNHMLCYPIKPISLRLQTLYCTWSCKVKIKCFSQTQFCLKTNVAVYS